MGVAQIWGRQPPYLAMLFPCHTGAFILYCPHPIRSFITQNVLKDFYWGIFMGSNQSREIEGKMKTTKDTLGSIVAISEAVNQSLDLDQILQIALDTVLKLEGLDAGTIRIIDEQSDTLILKAYRGLPLKAIKKLKKIKLGEKFSGLVALTGEPIVVNDIFTSPWLAEIYEARPDLKSLASIPLKSVGKISGSMNIYSPKADHFNKNKCLCI